VFHGHCLDLLAVSLVLCCKRQKREAGDHFHSKKGKFAVTKDMTNKSIQLRDVLFAVWLD
jgi:hypothetical protein